MNIFMVDSDPKIAAQMLVDKHIVKMPTETCQMLSTCHRVLDGRYEKKFNAWSNRYVSNYILENEKYQKYLMQACYINHPCNVWLRQSEENYIWLYEHYIALLEEYTFRYGKKHRAGIAKNLLKKFPKNLGKKDRTQLICSISSKTDMNNYNEVENYRNFYLETKRHIFSWKNRSIPHWIL